jgi:hypothetical protein
MGSKHFINDNNEEFLKFINYLVLLLIWHYINEEHFDLVLN